MNETRVRSVDGMTLAGKNQSDWRKIVPLPLFVPQFTQGPLEDQALTSAMRRQRLTKPLYGLRRCRNNSKFSCGQTV